MIILRASKGTILQKTSNLSRRLSAKLAMGDAHWVTVKSGPLAGRHLLIDGPAPAAGKKSRGKILAGHGIPKHLIRKITGATHAHHLDHEQSNGPKRFVVGEHYEPVEAGPIRIPKSGIFIREPEYSDEDKRTNSTNGKTLRDVERNIRNNRTESGHIFDKKGNVVWSNPGGVDYVDVSDAVKNGHMKGNVFTHNHPGGNSFSPEDIDVMLSHGLAEIRAVSKKHSFSMKPPHGFDGSLQARRNVFSEYNKAEEEVRTELQSLVNSGIITPNEASQRHFHDIWTRVAKRTGMKYERTDADDLKKGKFIYTKNIQEARGLYARQGAQRPGLRKTDWQKDKIIIRAHSRVGKTTPAVFTLRKSYRIVIRGEH